MENIQGSNGPFRPGYGPPSGPRRRSARPALSQARADLLEHLHGQPQPITLAALGAATGLHANTLREHLDALAEAGLVRRHRAEPEGRGRPAWLYEATADDEPGRSTEYAGLAAALASAIERSSDAPREDAILAGTEWGHELARGKGGPTPATKIEARRRVVELLEDIGFAPEPDTRQAVVKLTRCPLLEAAHRHPEVVCGVHLGIVRGALEEYGGDPERTDLLPFAEPGACRLHLLTRGNPEAQ